MYVCVCVFVCVCVLYTHTHTDTHTYIHTRTYNICICKGVHVTIHANSRFASEVTSGIHPPVTNPLVVGPRNGRGVECDLISLEQRYVAHW